MGLVSPAGHVLARAAVRTGRSLTADELVAAIAAAARPMLSQGPQGVGVAAPGFRLPDGSGVVNVGNLPSLDHFPLRASLQQALGLPTTLDNDANAAAVGEYRYGAGRGAARLLVVTVGTGIGAGMVVGGAVHRVCEEGLGDPGHVIVREGGPQCNCGGHGCAEAIASAPALLRRAQDVRGQPCNEFGELVAAARTGEEAALRILEEGGWVLGQALATLVHLLGPELVLLGGGALDAAGDLLLAPAHRALFAHVQPYFGKRLRLDRAALGNDAGLVGAAALAPAG